MRGDGKVLSYMKAHVDPCCLHQRALRPGLSARRPLFSRKPEPIISSWLIMWQIDYLIRGGLILDAAKRPQPNVPATASIKRLRAVTCARTRENCINVNIQTGKGETLATPEANFSCQQQPRGHEGGGHDQQPSAPLMEVGGRQPPPLIPSASPNGNTLSCVS